MTSPSGPDPFAGPAAAPGRIGWRRVILILLVLGGAAVAVEHIVGGRMSLWVLAAGIGVTGLAAGVWRFPHLMRHFHPFGLRERRQRTRTTTRTFGSPRRTPGSLLPGRKSEGGRMLPKLGGSRARRGTGSGKAGSGSRRLLPGLGRRGKTGLGKSRAGGGQARKPRAATRASGRSPGAGRRKSSPFRRSGGAGGGKRRLAPGLKRSGTGSRRKAGILRRNRAGSRKNRANTGSPRRNRAQSPASRRRHARWQNRQQRRQARWKARQQPAGTRRKLTRPSTWRRRNRNGQQQGPPNGRRAPGVMPGGPQRLNRRQAWKARRAARAAARQARAGRVRSRLGFAGWALRHPSTWRRPKNAPSRPPGRMRRGLHRVIGTPQQRHNRRAAAKAHRANQRARRIRLARNPYGSRFRWHAPWRAWTRGPGARALFHRWRVNRGHVAPRGRNGQKLPWGMRARRRWNIWRGSHRGFGFGQQPRSRRRRLAGLRKRWQNRRPPLPLARHGQPRWMQRMLGRVDQRRGNRWAQRRRRTANSPLRPPSAPRPKIAVAGHWAPARNISNLAPAAGGHMIDPAALADEIRSLMAGDFNDSNHAHDILTNLSEVVRATQETLEQVAEKVHEAPGITNDYAEAAREAAGGMSGIADQLQEKIGLGIV